jgi:hypothetical protein
VCLLQNAAVAPDTTACLPFAPLITHHSSLITRHSYQPIPFGMWCKCKCHWPSTAVSEGCFCLLDKILTRSGLFAAQVVILGTGAADYEERVRAASHDFGWFCRGHVGFSVPLSHKIIAGCDILLMPSR